MKKVSWDILKIVTIVLAVVALGMMFLPLIELVDGTKYTDKAIAVLGTDKVNGLKVLFGITEEVKNYNDANEYVNTTYNYISKINFVAILMFACPIIGAIITIMSDKKNLTSNIVAAIFFVAGAVMMILIARIFANSFNVNTLLFGNNFSNSQEALFNKEVGVVAQNVKMSIGAIVFILVSICAAAATVCRKFIKK